MSIYFSFDGFGINDARDQFKPRIATLTEAGKAMKIGPVLAVAPEMLEALEFLLERTDAKNRFCPDLPMHQASAEWDKFMSLARECVENTRPAK